MLPGYAESRARGELEQDPATVAALVGDLSSAYTVPMDFQIDHLAPLLKQRSGGVEYSLGEIPVVCRASDFFSGTGGVAMQKTHILTAGLSCFCPGRVVVLVFHSQTRQREVGPVLALAGSPVRS